MLKGQGPATDAAYRGATADTQALAGGFSDTLRQGAQDSAAQTNAILQANGAPQGQMLNPAVGAGGADVAYGLGGFIPGAALAREGAAATAAANQLPGTVIGQGQRDAAEALRQGIANRQDLRDNSLAEPSGLADNLLTTQQQLGGQSAQQQAQLRADLATIAAGKPGLVQSALSNIQQAQVQQAGLAQNAALLPLVLSGKFQGYPGTDPITGLPTTTQIGINEKNADRTVKTQTAALKAKSFSASASRALGYRADALGNPMGGHLQLLPGFTINAKGDIVKGATGKGEKLSTSELQRFTFNANRQAANMHDGFTDAKTGDEFPAIGYDQAVAEMQKCGFFVTPQLRQIAVNALWNLYGRPQDYVIDHTRPRTTG